MPRRGLEHPSYPVLVLFHLDKGCISGNRGSYQVDFGSGLDQAKYATCKQGMVIFMSASVLKLTFLCIYLCVQLSP